MSDDKSAKMHPSKAFSASEPARLDEVRQPSPWRMSQELRARTMVDLARLALTLDGRAFLADLSSDITD